MIQSKINKRYYALKVLKKAEIVKLKQVEHTNNERAILHSIQHPFIVNFWGSFQDSLNLYMVLDYVPGGELFSVLRKAKVNLIPGWLVEKDYTNHNTFLHRNSVMT